MTGGGCRATILLCTYNGEATLETALRSAAAQETGGRAFEVLVVDDGSADGTAAAAERFSREDPRVRLLRLGANRGLAGACNAGLEAARGEYILRLDDDDELDPEALSAMCPFLESGEADWVYSDRTEVDEESGERVRVEVGPFNVFRLIACGVLMRKALIAEAGGYRPLFWEEYDLFLRYLEKAGGPAHYVPRPLYVYTRRTGGMTGERGRVEAGWAELADLWGRDALAKHGWSPASLAGEAAGRE
ncbi:MAG: glycosyltransferase family 2 protein [bacterium]